MARKCPSCWRWHDGDCPEQHENEMATLMDWMGWTRFEAVADILDREILGYISDATGSGLLLRGLDNDKI